MTSPTGLGTVATTRPAATAARSRRPRSFHDVTKARAPSSYTSAARALANANRRPPHSAQRRTGHGPGAPQRSQHGGTHRTSRARQGPQTDSPTRRQTPHRRGSNTSRKCTQRTVETHVSQERADFVPKQRYFPRGTSAVGRGRAGGESSLIQRLRLSASDRCTRPQAGLRNFSRKPRRSLKSGYFPR